MKIFYIIATAFYFFLIWDDLSIANENWTPEFKEFCKAYMPYVNQYPDSMSAGCCDINHHSNDLLKEGYKGESLLICDGKIIDGQT